MAKTTDNEIVKTLIEFHQKGTHDNSSWRKRARTAMAFYLGNSWDSDDVSLLDSEGRPHLSINLILSVVNLLSGIQRQNRQDIKVYARHGGTELVAQVLTALAKHTFDCCNGDWEVASWFLDGIITGKGWIDLDIDYQYDPLQGDLVLAKTGCFDVVEDREGDEYDLNRSCKYIIKTQWQDKEKLKLQWPKHKTDFEDGGLDLPPESADVWAAETDSYQAANVGEPSMTERKFRWRVRKCYWKEWKKREFLINTTTGLVQSVAQGKEELAARFANRPDAGWVLRERVTPVLRRTMTVGHVVLEDIEDPYDGMMMYPLIRFCPYFVDDNIMGTVDNLIDPQQELNKRRSQALHHLNQSANSGWVGDSDAMTASQWEELSEFGSKPGGIIKKRPGSQLERISPAPVSDGHLTFAEMGKQDIKDISAVNADLTGGKPERQESGRAMLLRQRQGLAANEIVFDNFELSYQILSQTVIDFIRAGRSDGSRMSALYSDAEILAVIQKDKLEVAIEQLGSLKVGRYGIKISQNPSNPTLQWANYEMLRNLLKDGLPIDPKFILQASAADNKDEIIADIAAKQQAAGMIPPTAGGGPGLPQRRPSPDTRIPQAVAEGVLGG